MRKREFGKALGQSVLRVLGIVSLLWSGVAIADADSNTCLQYGADVTIQGRLVQQTFAEQPNYNSIANGDAKATYFFLAPDQPLCAAPGHVDAGDVGEENLKIVQLVFMGKEDMFGPLKPLLGQPVQCKGQLMHAISGHHHSRILLTTSSCGLVSGGMK